MFLYVFAREGVPVNIQNKVSIILHAIQIIFVFSFLENESTLVDFKCCCLEFLVYSYRDMCSLYCKRGKFAFFAALLSFKKILPRENKMHMTIQDILVIS